MWAFVWWPHALLHGLNPFVTHTIWTPHGANVAVAAQIPAASLLMSPITALFGPIVSYNVLSIAAPVLAGWFTFRLCRYLTARWAPSLIGGYLFGFSSYELGHLLGHLNLVLTFLVPATVHLVLLWLDERVSSRRFVVLLTGIFVIQLGLSTEILTTLVGIGGVTLLLAYRFSESDRRRRVALLPPRILLAGAAAALLTAPFLYYALTGLPTAKLNWATLNDLTSADLLNYVVPTPLTWIGHGTVGVFAHSNFSESTAYLGLPVLLIMALFLFTRRREPLAKLLTATLVLLVIASLGPHLHVASPNASSTGAYAPSIPLPWLFLSHLAGIDHLLAGRVTMYVSLLAAVIVALWLAQPSRQGYRKWVLAGAGVALLIPNLAQRFWDQPIADPVFFANGAYRQYVARGQTALIIPFGANGNSMLWQAQTGMYFRMPEGYIGLGIPADYVHDPGANDLLDFPSSPSTSIDLARRWPGSFAGRKVATVIVQAPPVMPLDPADQPQRMQQLRNALSSLGLRSNTDRRRLGLRNSTELEDLSSPVTGSPIPTGGDVTLRIGDGLAAPLQPLDPGKRHRVQTGVPIVPALDGLRWIALFLVISGHAWSDVQVLPFRGTASPARSAGRRADRPVLHHQRLCDVPANCRTGWGFRQPQGAMHSGVSPGSSPRTGSACCANCLLPPLLRARPAPFTTFGFRQSRPTSRSCKPRARWSRACSLGSGWVRSKSRPLDAVGSRPCFYLALPFIARRFYRRPLACWQRALLLSALTGSRRITWRRPDPCAGITDDAGAGAAVRDRAFAPVPGLRRRLCDRHVLCLGGCSPGAAAARPWQSTAALLAALVPYWRHPAVTRMPLGIDAAAHARYHLNALTETLVPLGLGILVIGASLAPAWATRPLSNRWMVVWARSAMAPTSTTCRLLYLGMNTLGFPTRPSQGAFLETLGSPHNLRRRRLALLRRARGAYPPTCSALREADPVRTSNPTRPRWRTRALNVLWFIETTAGNAFMNELLRALAAAAARAGINVAFHADGYPEYVEGDAYVAIPHELFECARRAWTGAHREQLAATVAVCVEQPGTQWFELTARYAAELGGAVAIHRTACRALAHNGVDARHLQLGYAPEWDAWHGAPKDREVDVLYMGTDDSRRASLLAGHAAVLHRRSSRLLIPELDAKPAATSNFLIGGDKYRQLADAKLLLNLHRSRAAGLLEWMRVLEAMCNGCVVISEHSADVAPLRAGEHFLSARPEHLALLANGLLDNPDRLGQIRRASYEFLRNELTMDAGISVLIDAALAAVERAPSTTIASSIKSPNPPAAAQSPDLDALVAAQLQPVRAALKNLTLEALDTRRRLHALADAGDDPDPQPIAETPSFAHQLEPRISVLVSLHNYEREVVEALASVDGSLHRSYEVLILDDSSTDGSVQAVQRFMEQRPWMPAKLFGHRCNRGLPRTRNALIERARGEFVFILDADNAIFPMALQRLEAAIDHAPKAAFAYGISVVEQDACPTDLISVGVWSPRRLAKDNYIDAMALIRRDVLIDLGGFCEDIRLLGWEDYDLWLRIAECGLAAIHVPQVVGCYRRTRHSMLASITDIDTTVARSIVSKRSPLTFAGTARTEAAVGTAGSDRHRETV